MIADETNAGPAAQDREAIAEAVRKMLRRERTHALPSGGADAGALSPANGLSHSSQLLLSTALGLSPTLQQVLALSELSGSRLWDWLWIFGFSLDDIPRLQSVLLRPRNNPDDKDLIDPQTLLPFLRLRRSEPRCQPLLL